MRYYGAAAQGSSYGASDEIDPWLYRVKCALGNSAAATEEPQKHSK